MHARYYWLMPAESHLTEEECGSQDQRMAPWPILNEVCKSKMEIPGRLRVDLRLALVLVGFCAGYCQTGSAPHRFEVASIKPSDPRSTGAAMKYMPGGRVEISGMTIQNLIQLTYGVRSYQIQAAPKWLDSDKYDISAKPQTGSTVLSPADRKNQDEQKLRLQGLLADRCGLKVHRESKILPVYLLTVAPAGLKMQPVKDGVPEGNGLILPMSMLVTDLAVRLDTPVIDQTGLSGSFYVKLVWESDDGKLNGVGVRTDGPDAAGLRAPSISAAMREQLGLKLQLAKGPVDILVIDHVERPSAN